MGERFEIISASVTDRGLSDKRPQNEDSYIDYGEFGIFAVADGVGGAQAGDVASQMAVEIIGEAFVNQTSNFDAEERMRSAIEQANSAIHHMSSELPQLSSMATTLVALHLSGNIATIGHVGDSRLYKVDRSGQLVQETRDHSVVEEEVRAGRLTPEQALTHPSRNIISRALGAESTVEIDLKTIMVEAGTTFLLCSDGITKHVTDQEINDLLAFGADPDMVCKRLKELCYKRGAEDNLTAVMVRVAEKPAESYAVAGAADAGTSSSFDTEDHEEEETIATARSPFDSTISEETIEIPAAAEVFQEIQQAEAAPDELDDRSYLMDEAVAPVYEEKPENLSGYTSSSVIVPAAPASRTQTYSPTRVITENTRRPGGSASNLITSIAMLVLGTILGAAVFYFWSSGSTAPEPQPEPAPALEAKSGNVPLVVFEEGRRLVDRDPQGYINANAASSQSPVDYFLMGRAFLLTGKYWEAKRAFTEAKNRLAQADPVNAKTLAAEIEMGLAIIESPGASEAFTKAMSSVSSAPSNTAAPAGSAATAPANIGSALANRSAAARPTANVNPAVAASNTNPPKPRPAATTTANVRPVR
jgi:serine/threonine protein phosphatase PrpC